MNILIFGASGSTGKELVKQGLREGHFITAFVRDSASLSEKNKNLAVFNGDILDLKNVTLAIKGQDVIISVLGNKTLPALWKSNTIISTGLKNIISGMKTHTVKRLLFVTSFGVNENIFLPEKIFIRTVLKNIFADIPLQEKMIRESKLNWTIVHPARLVNTPKTATYHVGVNLAIGLFSKISRADIVDFLLHNINVPTYVGKTVTVSY